MVISGNTKNFFINSEAKIFNLGIHMNHSPLTHSYNASYACEYGIDGAVLIHHFQYWINANQRKKINFRDGHTWTYQTLKDIAAHYPYWSVKQVERFIKKLVDKGVLIKANYNKSPFERVIWYAFANEDKFCNWNFPALELDEEEENKENFSKRQNREMGIPESRNLTPEIEKSNKDKDAKPYAKNKNKRKDPASPLAAELLTFFISSLKENVPEVVEMPKDETALIFDTLLKNYSPEEIKCVISFSHSDEFWRIYVHGPKYLKSKFATLMAANRRLLRSKTHTEKVVSNIDVAKDIMSKIKLSDNDVIEYYANHLELGRKDHHQRYILTYSEKGFEEQFMNLLRKMGLI